MTRPDIVQRLRAEAADPFDHLDDLCREAADEIVRLRVDACHALDSYARHLSCCAVRPCTCGLDETRAALATPEAPHA